MGIAVGSYNVSGIVIDGIIGVTIGGTIAIIGSGGGRKGNYM